MFAQWFLWRLTFPLAIAGVVAASMWGYEFFEVFTALLWTTFLGHLAVTIAFNRTHILDTGSFFCLIFCFGAVAEMAEARGYRSPNYWVFAAVAFVVYSLLSLIGRARACRRDPSVSKRSVTAAEVIVAAFLVVVAVGACSANKTAVGFLFAPAVFFIPAVLLYSLFNRSKTQ